MAGTDRECGRRIEELVRKVDGIEDPVSRDVARQLMEAILEFHGDGLNRIMELTVESVGTGEALIRRFGGDELVSSLLVLHDLHPDNLETRARRAIARWQGSAELINEFEGVVRVRLLSGLGESLAIAIREAAPDAVEVIVVESMQSAGGFVPLTAIGMSGARLE